MDGDLKTKIQQAKSQGYSEKEINDYLGQSDTALAGKIKTARDMGYSEPDIMNFMSGMEYKPSGATAVPVSTATVPMQKKQSRPLGEVVSQTLAPLKYATHPEQAAMDWVRDPKGTAEMIGTSLETGLPLLAANPLIPAPVRPALMGLLQGTGTAIKSGLMDIASGEKRPIISGTDLADIALATQGIMPSSKKTTSSGKESLLSRIDKSVMSGIIGAGAGEIVGAGAQKLLSPFSENINPSLLETSKQYGIKPLPSEMFERGSTGAHIEKYLEELSSRSIGGAGIVGKVRSENFRAFQSYADDVLSKIGPETQPGKLKELVNAMVEGNENAFREVGGKMFDAVDQAAKKLPATPVTEQVQSKIVSATGEPITMSVSKEGGAVPITRVKEFAQKVMSELPEQVQVAVREGGQEASQLYKQINNILELPDAISFKDAEFYRSQLLSTIRAETQNVPGQVTGSAKRLANLFDTDMENAAKAAGSDVYDKYRAASAFWKQGKDVFNHDAVLGLAKDDPEKLAENVFSAKSGEAITAVKKALDPDTFREIKQGLPNTTWQRFKRAGVAQLIDDNVFKVAARTGDIEMRGANLYNTLRSFGDETLNSFLSPEEKRALLKFAQMSARVGTKEPSMGLWGTGQVYQLLAGMVTMAEGAMFHEPLMGLGTTGAVIGVPAFYAKLITSDFGRKLLTEGYHIKPGTRAAMAFIGRLGSYLASESNKSPIPQPKYLPVTKPESNIPDAKKSVAPQKINLQQMKAQWGKDATEGYSDDELAKYLEDKGYQVER